MISVSLDYVCVWCVLRRKNKKGENGEKIKNKDIHKSTTIFQIGEMGDGGGERGKTLVGLFFRGKKDASVKCANQAKKMKNKFTSIYI